MCGGGVLGLFFLVRTILNTKVYRNSDSHSQLRVTVRISPSQAELDAEPRNPATLWCAPGPCARGRVIIAQPLTTPL